MAVPDMYMEGGVAGTVVNRYRYRLLEASAADEQYRDRVPGAILLPPGIQAVSLSGGDETRRWAESIIDSTEPDRFTWANPANICMCGHCFVMIRELVRVNNGCPCGICQGDV